jgi:hypothetical protein
MARDTSKDQSLLPEAIRMDSTATTTESDVRSRTAARQYEPTLPSPSERAANSTTIPSSQHFRGQFASMTTPGAARRNAVRAMRTIR